VPGVPVVVLGGGLPDVGVPPKVRWPDEPLPVGVPPDELPKGRAPVLDGEPLPPGVDDPLPKGRCPPTGDDPLPKACPPGEAGCPGGREPKVVARFVPGSPDALPVGLFVYGFTRDEAEPPSSSSSSSSSGSSYSSKYSSSLFRRSSYSSPCSRIMLTLLHSSAYKLPLVITLHKTSLNCHVVIITQL
jgi:hypothetical protein